MTTAAEASMINPVALFMEADIVVQAIMIGLTIASLWSWAVIIDKAMRFSALNSQANTFEDAVGEHVVAGVEGADIDADPLRVAFRHNQSGIIDRHLGRGEAVVDERVHAPDFLGRHPLVRLEVFHFPGKPGRQHRRIEPRDGTDTAAAVDHVIPGLGNTISDGRDDTETRYDDASF